MVKFIFTYVDSHVLVEYAKGVRVFNEISDAIEFVRSELEQSKKE